MVKKFTRKEENLVLKIITILLSKDKSGREHSVVTGFTIIDTQSGKTVTDSVDTKVFFRKLSLREIDAYEKTGEPMDKAGAYAMQEKAAIFIEKIDGDPYNVIGLPLQEVTEALKKFGIKILT